MFLPSITIYGFRIGSVIRHFFPIPLVEFGSPFFEDYSASAAASAAASGMEEAVSEKIKAFEDPSRQQQFQLTQVAQDLTGILEVQARKLIAFVNGEDTSRNEFEKRL